MTIEVGLTLMVRIGMVMLFLPFSALDKLLNFRGAVRQAQIRLHSRALAVMAIVAGFGVELVTSLGIVTGIADRLAAVVVAGYCVMTALLFKPFWNRGDFWRDSNGEGRTLFWDFLKNMSLGAAFLLITVGSDGVGARMFLDSPLSSTDPYALVKES